MDLKELFAGILNEPIESINENTGPTTTLNWTSLVHLQLVTSMEDLYGVKFSNTEIKEMKSFGICQKMLESKGVMV
ncbi:MAG: acyl carrier protein [Chloroflexia bacterium]|nr:acyl carrier protein [Chloroflexia bacterium]